MNEIILIVVGLIAIGMLFVYIVRSIIRQRYYMSERTITRNPHIEAMKERVYGNQVLTGKMRSRVE
jgi:uncharacterized membrane protein